MLKEKLLEDLRAYKKNGQTLKVEWNAGGDETIIGFYLDNKVFSHYNNEVYTEFASYLIEEFDLPNAGEYYNEGGGIITIEDDGKISFEYNEYAYSEVYDDEFESENSVEEFFIPATEQCKNLLRYLNEVEIDFYGSTSFRNEISDHFNIYSKRNSKSIGKAKMPKLHEEIKKNALAKLTPPLDNSEIMYSGMISEEYILYEEIYQIKYFVEKNHVGKRAYLLE